MADDETQQTSTEEETTHLTEDETSGASTPEDIEAYWRTRTSGIDKKWRALEAENKVLRERESASKSGTESAGNATGTDAANELVSRLQAELEAERKARISDTRAAKYPHAAKAVGDVNILAAMDEANLASLNESLTPVGTASRPTDPNNPGRTVKGPKPISEMTTEELKAHLRTQPVPGVR